MFAIAAQVPLPEKPADHDPILPESAQPPPSDETSQETTPAERWQYGYDAFRRGEIPPADADEAEGWYWAENEASRR